MTWSRHRPAEGNVEGSAAGNAGGRERSVYTGRGAGSSGGTRAAGRRRPAGALALGLGLAALAGCGAPAPATAPSTPPAPVTVTQTAEPDPTPASPTATPVPGTATPTSVATLTGGNGLARGLVLGAGFLPPGWTDTTARDTGGYRMAVCGVDLEPSNPVDGAQKRWQASASGPYLEQHVRVYTGNTARDVVAGLARALPTCTTYTATDSAGGSSTYTVDRMSLPSASGPTVTWRQRLVAAPPASRPTAATPSPPASPGGPLTLAPSAPATTGRAPELVQDVAVSRVGSSIVLLAAYAVNAKPDAAVLDAALKEVQAKRS